MRWAALVSLAAGVVVALSVAQFAPGQAIERVRVDRPSAALPESLYLIVAPRRVRPGCVQRHLRKLDRPTVLATGLSRRKEQRHDRLGGRLRRATLATERIALANLTRDWTEDQRAGISIEHVVGRRVVGTIPGFFVLQVERRSAPSELVVAFPVAPKLHVFVRFLLLSESDAYVVKGSMLASSWNRGQALLAMSRTRLEGNLPPGS